MADNKQTNSQEEELPEDLNELLKVIYDDKGKKRLDLKIDYDRIENFIIKTVRTEEKKRRRSLIFLLGIVSLIVLFIGVNLYIFFFPTIIEVPYSDKVELIRVGQNEFYVAPFTKGVISIIEGKNEIRAQSANGEFYIRKFATGELFIEIDSILVRMETGTASIVNRGPFRKLSVLNGEPAILSIEGKDITVLPGEEYRDYPNQKGKVQIGHGTPGSWRIGYYLYNSEPLDFVLSDIERHFLIRINRSNDISDLIVSGIFDRSQDVLEVLRGLLPPPYSVKQDNDSTYTISSGGLIK